MNVGMYSKELQDLSFEDLCVELPEQTYPTLKADIGKIIGRLHIKRAGVHVCDTCKRLFHAPLSTRTRTNH